MTTAQLETTAVGPAAMRAPARRWRPIVAIVLVAAIVAASAAFVWAASVYQPLVSLGGGYGAGLTAGGGYDSTAIDNAYGTEFRVIEPRAGEEIGMLFELTNNGPLGVTVVSVAQPFNPTGEIGTGMHPDETSGGHATRPTDVTEQEWVDVTPFSLPAGGRTEIRLTFQILDCATELLAPGSRDIVTTVPVTFRVLGQTRTVDVVLPYALSIESLPHCPSAPTGS